MTNYLINSSLTLLSGTKSNDLFDFRTAAAVSVFGSEGSDQFSAQGVSNLNASVLDGGLGDDVFGVSGIASIKASLLGGEGDDLVTGSLASVGQGIVVGGAGNDTIVFGHLSGHSNTINGNVGEDLIFFSGSISSTRVLGGAASDTIEFASLGLSSSTIQGGGGSDLISGEIGGQGSAAYRLIVAGDAEFSLGDFDGNDTIYLHTKATIDALIQGNGGNDQITILNYSTAMVVAGNAGNDTISLGGITGAPRGAVNLGAGNDLLSAVLDDRFSDFSINGGGGDDTITLTALSSASDQLSAFFFGGDGADLFELRGEGFAAISGGQVSYANAMQSNLGAMDTISARVGAGGVGSASTTGYRVFVDYVNVVTAETADTQLLSIRGTEAVFTATFALGATARVSALDTFISAAGSTVYFADGLGTDLIFVQGGLVGASDDLVIKNSTQGITSMLIERRGAGLRGGTLSVGLGLLP